MPIEEIRKQFPPLSQPDSPLVYFDNAATTLKPVRVIQKEMEYYSHYPANVHRGVHRLSEHATKEFEETRQVIAEFLNAKSTEEVIFTSGTTHALNLVAMGWGSHHLRAGDEILITEMEHHANIVPWHLLRERTGISVRYIPLQPDGTLELEKIPQLLSRRTRIVSFVMVSNALGVINPVSEMIGCIQDICPHAHIVLDAAQAVSHSPIDVQALGCSALAFSSHKLFGPTGAGALYLREDFRDEFSPVFGGGDMIREVTMDGSTYADFPSKLEPGTPNIAGFIGLKEAIRTVQEIGFQHIQDAEERLNRHMQERLKEMPSVHVYGLHTHRVPTFSFSLPHAHPHDVASILDRYGVAVRSGHHCAQPAMRALGTPATTRASLSFYNTPHEIDQFVEALNKTKDLLS